MLLGLNGAGKSTLFSLVTHLYARAIRRGRASSATTSRANRGAALARLGVVFQQRTLDPDLSVEQNLAYHAALHGIGRARGARARRDRARRASASPTARATRRAISRAARCGASRSRARCCTTRACCCSTSRRRASTSRRAPTFSRMCATWSRDEGVGVLWTTHLVDEVRDDDDVVVLHKGSVLADGPVARRRCARRARRRSASAFAELTGARRREEAA